MAKLQDGKWSIFHRTVSPSPPLCLLGANLRRREGGLYPLTEIRKHVSQIAAGIMHLPLSATTLRGLGTVCTVENLMLNFEISILCIKLQNGVVFSTSQAPKQLNI